MRKMLCILLLALVLPIFSLPVWAADKEQTKPYVQGILNYYLHYQQEAQPEMDVLLDMIGAADPAERETWEKILKDWTYYREELPLNPDVLPDGLPEDDSLCIVVMGYRLNPNGTIQPELEGRLTVALESARKYPNAYILCTGGPTARNGWTTEGAQMRQWLMDRGISWKRIIVEEKSLSTTENAMYSLPIIQKRYPSIEKLAIITSDYHVPRSCLMFSVTADYNACYAGYRPLEVVANAAYMMDNGTVESLYTQAWGIAIVAGVEIDNREAPVLERVPQEETVETVAVETAPPETEPTVAVTEPEVPAAVEAAEPEEVWDASGAVLTIIAGFTVLTVLLEIWERRKG